MRAVKIDNRNQKFEMFAGEIKKALWTDLSDPGPKRLFYPTFAVEAKLPFPMETGG
jgi:hypothetical protein